MPSPINFQIIESESAFLDPRSDYQPTAMKFQVRMDPLTGRTGHFSHFGRIAPQKLDLESYSKPELKGFCPFCPEKREKATPKFLKEIFPEGRASRGEAMLVPNLFPYEVHSGIMIMTANHVVPLSGFNEKRLFDAFLLGMEFLKRTRIVSPLLPYHLVTWNYMPPSGGGLVHPHQQYFATEYPGNQLMDELKASQTFYAKHGKTYWAELVDEEMRRGDRYIGQTGNVHWLASFVCFSLLGDIFCVIPDVFSIDDFKENHINNLVSGLLKIFRYYESARICSFNMSLLFGPKGQQSFPCHLRIKPRTFLNMRDFASDMAFFQTTLAEPVCVKLPEELCLEAKKYF
jgi:UDPglucose--hexose-1-phosphate uridylyltransferase